MPIDEADYVVVGSGAGGGTVSARLAEGGASVVVLEAGTADEDFDYQVPAFHGRSTENPRYSWEFFVRHYADTAQQRRDPKFTEERDGVFYPRAATVGGCTAHNAMITVYPHHSDWSRIAAETGDPSWAPAAMRAYFQRLERCTYADRPRRLPANPWLAALLGHLPVVSALFTDRARHGFDGWLPTTLADPRLLVGDPQLLDAVVAGAEAELADALHRPLRLPERLKTLVDPNDWHAAAEGLWLVPQAIGGGRRASVRERLAGAAEKNPGRLEVRTGSLATRVLLDDAQRAVGVEYLAGEHLYRADPAHRPVPAGDPERLTIHARREVILAGGAFNTPQLLMLSGIGPAAHLAEHGITVRADLPGVGANLQDRYEVGVVSEVDEAFLSLRDLTYRPPGPGEEPDRGMREWAAGRGPYATNGVLLGLTRRSRPELHDPDLFLFGLPAAFTGYYPGYSTALAQHRDRFTWAILKAHTSNRTGRVTLRSDSPLDVPDIRFHYFEEGDDPGGHDLDAVVTGLELARGINRRSGAVRRELTPGDQYATRDDLREFVRDNAWGHHACGTCRIGPAGDPLAVTDSRFRVHGITGLRVVDASVFPRIPGFFIATPTYMVAEKAADVILADTGRRATAARPTRTARPTTASGKARP